MFINFIERRHKKGVERIIQTIGEFNCSRNLSIYIFISHIRNHQFFVDFRHLLFIGA
jgi:hypothetical protein